MIRTATFQNRFGEEIEREVLSEVISGSEWKDIFEHGYKWWSQNKPGTYGVGLLNSPNDSARTERLGILGENAFSNLFGGTPNHKYRDKGDGGKDLRYGKHTVNIKVAVRQKEYGIIYAQSDVGRKVSLLADIFVFGVIREFIEHKKPSTLDVRRSVEKNNISGYARVDFLGWIWKDEINLRAKYLSDDHRSTHLNFHVPYVQMHEMNELFQHLALRKSVA